MHFTKGEYVEVFKAGRWVHGRIAESGTDGLTVAFDDGAQEVFPAEAGNVRSRNADILSNLSKLAKAVPMIEMIQVEDLRTMLGVTRREFFGLLADFPDSFGNFRVSGDFVKMKPQDEFYKPPKF